MACLPATTAEAGQELLYLVAAWASPVVFPSLLKHISKYWLPHTRGDGVVDIHASTSTSQANLVSEKATLNYKSEKNSKNTIGPNANTKQQSIQE